MPGVVSCFPITHNTSLICFFPVCLLISLSLSFTHSLIQHVHINNSFDLLRTNYPTIISLCFFFFSPQLQQVQELPVSNLQSNDTPGSLYTLTSPEVGCLMTLSHCRTMLVLNMRNIPIFASASNWRRDRFLHHRHRLEQ